MPIPLDAVRKEAKRRIRENANKYVRHVYGQEEAGGTCWMYISEVPFEELGFNMKVPKVNLPRLTWKSLSRLPATAGGFVLALSAIAWFRNRGDREE